MNLEYIDHNDLHVTPEEINACIDTVNSWSDKKWVHWQEWWSKQQLPEGLQCVEIHLHMSLFEWINELLVARRLNPFSRKLRIMVALQIDNTIH
jgi:hypothetical protein